MKKQKTKLKNEFSHLWDNKKKPNLCIIRVLEREYKI